MSTRAKAGWLAAMIATGAALLVAMFAMVEARMAQGLAAASSLPQTEGPTAGVADRARGAHVPTASLRALEHGLAQSLELARRSLGEGDVARAAQALDHADRAADVAATGSGDAPSLVGAREHVRSARHALQMGRAGAAYTEIEDALGSLRGGGVPAASARGDDERLSGYVGATVIDAHGARIGEVVGERDGELELALGGARDVAGLVDLGASERLRVGAGDVVLGRRRGIGSTLVALPARTSADDRAAK